MAEMAFICLYRSYLDFMERMPDEERGRLVLAMLLYAVRGKQIRLKGEAKILWPMIRSQMDRDTKRYEEICQMRRSNGIKGGRPRKNHLVSEETICFSEKPKEPNKNENENTNKKEKENKKETFVLTDDGGKPAPFTPSLEEVQAYVQAEGLAMNPSAFVDYYASRGWMVGTTPMKDWKAAVRNWNRKEFKYGNNELGDSEPVYGTVL